MIEKDIIEAGESYEFSFEREGGKSISGYTCTISLKQHPDDAAILTRVITEVSGDSWIGFLTETETTGLSPGLYFLIAVLDNAALDKKEIIREKSRFRVTKAWA